MTGRSATTPGPERPAALTAAVAACWERFWFTAADARPLAVVRIGSAAIALALWWSFVPDRAAWFGPAGLLPAETVREWRSPAAVSLFDAATGPQGSRILFGVVGGTLVALLLGAGTAVTAPAAAALWATLLNRVPMLAGPADDVVAVLLWCLALGPAGRHCSIDRWLADRTSRPPPQPTVRAHIALSLLQVHASAITAAALLAQNKGDVWWEGSAAWWMAARAGSRLVDLTGLLAGSEYLVNLVTHAITAFEIAFAIGIWFTASRRGVARVALVAWPLVGLLAGEPLWGLAMAIFAVPLADLPRPGRGTGFQPA